MPSANMWSTICPRPSVIGSHSNSIVEATCFTPSDPMASPLAKMPKRFTKTMLGQSRRVIKLQRSVALFVADDASPPHRIPLGRYPVGGLELSVTGPVNSEHRGVDCLRHKPEIEACLLQIDIRMQIYNQLREAAWTSTRNAVTCQRLMRTDDTMDQVSPV
jgi:hypothetical protein